MMGLILRTRKLSAAFLARYDPRETYWVGDRGSALGYSQGREFASMLRMEGALRKRDALRDIQVYLELRRGPVIELLSASSGELP